MSATVDQIEAALLAPFLTVADGGSQEWAGTGYDVIAYDNASFTPTTAPWIEVVTSAGAQRAQDVQAVVLIGHPTVTIAVHTGIGSGKQAARQLIGEAHAIYRGRQIMAGTSSLIAYAFSQPVEMPRDGYYKLATQISFRLI